MLPDNSLAVVVLSVELELVGMNLTPQSSGYFLVVLSKELQIDVRMLRSLVNSFECDSFETLVDYDMPRDVTFKKLAKVSDRTVVFCQQLFDQDEVVKGSAIFALGGGFNAFYRRKCSVDIGLRKEAAGYTVELHAFVGSEEPNLDEIKKILEETFDPLPPGKVRCTSGPFDPKMVKFLVEQGLDLFDSSYAVSLAEKNSAFRLADDYPASSSFVLTNFEDEKYADDFTKPFEDCSCYTCQNYTKGYLQHLVNTKELLASILLVIHNMTEYDRMFQLIRAALSISDDQ
ncbi:unnamed protein product [Caenorhabditis auriculariae]|uniref:tRNA-guanine(15) transglycosylase-like domain-containing protein n=1 Tax=Caenorhabditis auriculariae TaxID=2777116 RepID=A0A8S1GUV4_9PELO|nr:unnamed protein product [Caenorhabditis auriculariae]